MSRTIALLAGLAIVLAGLQRALEASRDEPNTEAYLREVLSAEERAAMTVAGVSILDPVDGSEVRYILSDGQWLCASAYGAVALTPQLEGLITDLTLARGEWVSADRTSEFGLGESEVRILRLHGPKLGTDPAGDVILELELGSSLLGLGSGRSYLRARGSSQVLEIDADPRSRLLTDPEKRLPPMLDERLLAGEWPARGEGLERAFIDFSDGRSIEIKSRVLGPAPSPELPAPRTWLAIQGETSAPVLPYRIGAWQAFLYRVPYRGLSDPAAAQRRGLDQPLATITLLQIQGDPIELVIGRSAPSGATFVLNRSTGMLCLLDRSEVELLLATLEQLCATELANPWEEWLPR
jgi:hypothetical protein